MPRKRGTGWMRGDEDMPPKRQCPIAVRRTYDMVDDSSAEGGENEADFADSGWVTAEGREWSTHKGGADKNWHEGRRKATVCFKNPREAAEFIKSSVGALDSAELDTYTPADASQDYRTGEATRVTAHVARAPSRNVAERIFCNVIQGDSMFKRDFERTCKGRKFRCRSNS